jgi:hypothetical protein
MAVLDGAHASLVAALDRAARVGADELGGVAGRGGAGRGGQCRAGGGMEEVGGGFEMTVRSMDTAVGIQEEDWIHGPDPIRLCGEGGRRRRPWGARRWPRTRRRRLSSRRRSPASAEAAVLAEEALAGAGRGG